MEGLSLWKYECPVCHRLVSLTKQGVLRAHGYRRQYGYGNTDYCEGTGQLSVPMGGGTVERPTRSKPASPARQADSSPSGDGNSETPEDQEPASGDRGPGEAHDQQGAVTVRLNVYAEELTTEVVVVTKDVYDKQFGERTFYGIRLFLKSPEELHSGPEDDDRSAITFWVPATATGKVLPQTLRTLFSSMIDALAEVAVP